MRNCPLHRTALLLYCLLMAAAARAQVQKLYLNPKSAGSGRQAQFVDSIRFIPLEAKEGIQLGAYNNITVTARHFLVISHLDKKLFLYSKKGAFIKEISYKKLGESFFPSYNEQLNKLVFFGNNKNYALTAKDRIKIRMDWDHPRNRKYFKKYSIDLSDTTYAIKKEIPQKNDIIGAHHFYGQYSWQGKISTSPLYQDSLDHELKIYQNNQLVKSFFPYNPINETRFLFQEENAYLYKTAVPSVQYVTRPYCDTIYKMVQDSLFPAYQLVLPLENSLPATFFTRPFNNKTERENYHRNNGWMFRQVHNFFETPRLIFFNIQYLTNSETYIYLKQTNTGYKTRNIKADSSQYNLTLLGDFGVLRKEDRFYKLQKAGHLTSFFEQHQTVPVPGELESYLNGKPDKDAPVIVEFKLKN